MQVGQPFVEVRRVVGRAVVAVFEALREVELPEGVRARWVRRWR